MDRREAVALEQEINAARPQTHKADLMWHSPGVYRVEIRSLRTLKRTFIFSRDEYLAARAHELKHGAAALV